MRARSGSPLRGAAWLTAARLSAPAVLLLALFAPEIRHYHVTASAIPPDALQAMRSAPSDSVLRELGAFTAFPPRRLSRDQVLALADSIRQGHFAYPDFPGSRLSVPLVRKEVDTVRLEFQLKLDGGLIPDVLMDAYELAAPADKDAYLLAARDDLIAWAERERSMWFPVGFIWNDHALASRMFVLARFWSHYRHHPAFSEKGARLLLQAADRCARLMAKPESFTFATNHGVMQNLGLLHAAAAFPGLERAADYAGIGAHRLEEQMTFYLSGTGVVMEHSVGYHEFGMPLVAMGLRYYALLGRPVPGAWYGKYAGMRRFYGLIRRPDGTLPMYGDTERKARDFLPVAAVGEGGGAGPLIPYRPSPPDAPAYFDPEAGYAVWWRGLEAWPAAKGLSQLAVAWPDFASHAHKRDDEMSVFLWAEGQDWWTGVGYWPYGVRGRGEAESWDGANAPHAVGEPRGIARRVSVGRHACAEGICLLDLERTTAEGYRARRQIVQLAMGAWLVLDAARDSLGRASRVTWTTLPDFRLAPGADANSFALENDAQALGVGYALSDGGRFRAYSGSREPFAGWSAPDKQVHSAQAFSGEFPAGGWALAAWKTSVPGAPPPRARMLAWEGPDKWSAEFVAGEARIAVRRDSVSVSAEAPGLPAARLAFPDRGPGPARIASEAAAAGLARAYREVAARYPRYAEWLFPYRVKVAWLIAALLAAQEILLFAIRRRSAGIGMAVSAASVPAWAALGYWVLRIYLRA